MCNATLIFTFLEMVIFFESALSNEGFAHNIKNCVKSQNYCVRFVKKSVITFVIFSAA